MEMTPMIDVVFLLLVFFVLAVVPSACSRTWTCREARGAAEWIFLCST